MLRALSYCREFVGSSLVRQITAFVLVSILSIEIVLLVVSYFNERERLLQRVEGSVSDAAPLILSGTTDVAAIEKLIVKQASQSQYPMIGALVSRPGAIDVAFGNTANLTSPKLILSDSDSESRYSSGSSTYDHFESVIDDRGVEVVKAWLRFDVSQINRELRSYVGRIVALIAAICLFVTTGCVLAARVILIKPVLKLRQVMNSVRKSGFSHLAIPAEQLARKDELGDLYRSFDRMRRDLLLASEARTRSVNRFQDFADLGADCFFETDADRSFKYISGDVKTLLGLEATQIVGRNIYELAGPDGLSLENPSEVFDSLEESGSWEGRLLPSQSAVPERLGRRKAVHIRVKKQLAENGQILGLRGVISDVTTASNRARDLTKQANHDALTGLVNRVGFQRRLEKSLIAFSEQQEPASVLMLDLDRFKVVNDMCGHLAGDDLLRQLSVLIRAQVRSGDIVARIGGDEFAVLLNGCKPDFGASIAEKIRFAIDEFRFLWQGDRFSVGVSIGVAQLCNEFQTTEDVMKAADACCYESKHRGRNRVTVYESNDLAPSGQQDGVQWLEVITEAIEEDRFELYCQSIVSLKNQSPAKRYCDLMLRIRSREGDLILPEVFRPAAERYGLNEEIDRWLLIHLVPWLAQRARSGDDELTVGVTLSVASISNPEFQGFLAELLVKNEESMSSIVFEVAETSTFHYLSGVTEYLFLLREIGCKIALVGFGSGFGSLDHIRQLPLDFIKIDGRSIRSVASDSFDRTLVQSISSVSRLLNVQTIAEFVENEETMSVLREIGIDFAQGSQVDAPHPLPGYSQHEVASDSRGLPITAEDQSGLAD